MMWAPDEKLGRRQLATMLREAEAAVEAGDFVLARKLLTRVLQTRPSAKAHLLRGRVHLDLGDHDDAMVDFMAAEDLAPVDAEPVVAIADLWFARKEYRRAIDHYDVAVDLEPRHAEACYRRGLCHFHLHDDDEALADFRRAERLDPDLPAVERNIELAERRIEQREREAARERAARGHRLRR